MGPQDIDYAKYSLAELLDVRRRIDPEVAPANFARLVAEMERRKDEIHAYTKMNEIETRGLTAGSLFRIVLVGWAFSLGPLLIFSGILSLFGFETFYTDGQPLTGFKGFLLSLILAPILVIFFTLGTWVFLAIGNSLYATWLRRRSEWITIYYKPTND